MAPSPEGHPGRGGAQAALALCLLLAAFVPDHADESAAAEPAPSKLLFSGRATCGDLGPLGEEKFRLDAEVRNPTAEPVEIRGGDVLLCHEGGWLSLLDQESLEGGFFRGSLTLAPGETRVVAGQSHLARTPATHAILSVDATDGPAQLAVPILREGFEAPPPCEPVRPFGVGVIGPLEAVRFADGKRAVLLLGQHQVLGGAVPQDLVTTVSIGSDKGSSEPITWKGLGGEGARNALWPFARRVEVFDGFEDGLLRLSARARVGDRDVSFASTWPVRTIEPVVMRSPVLGRWQLSNGPGQDGVVDQDVYPQARYAYDMVVLKQGRTHAGDPHDNAAYYAWNRSVRAVADGRVVHVCDSERDNPGYRGALTTCRNNRIVIEHADGLRTAYLHIRRRSVPQGLQLEGALVKAGQVIGRVGNSGDSSEPHLHFMAFRVDASGRIRSVPVTFSNAWHDAKATQPVEGVPLGGEEYYFRNVE